MVHVAEDADTPADAAPTEGSADRSEPAGEPAAPPEFPLLRLAEPVPPLTETGPGLQRVAAALAAGSGPVAIDAERASGHRYSQRAYLVQLRRAGSTTALVDPIAAPDMAPLVEALDGTEWVLHAASQDLPCLIELGLRPARLFDTELAGRLLNMPRVGLATLVAELYGHRLAKEHSAVDWSTRPLPEPWLEYAALDVEVLVELRHLLADRLVAAGKAGWAAEEFEALTHFTGPEPRPDPWRRTSGLHRVRGRRALGVVRELWEARDRLAAELDIAPGRVLSDVAIVEAAVALPRGRQALRALPGMRHRQARRHLDLWSAAVERALSAPDSQLPPTTGRTDGLPPPRSWPDRNPAAAARLRACRTVVAELCEQHDLPAENLLTPEWVRRLAWAPPEPIDTDTVGGFLRQRGAREWQVGLTAARFAEVMFDRAS
ncbi:ribonuclease D [soil metagenome]